jgi:hypothetical protein
VWRNVDGFDDRCGVVARAETPQNYTLDTARHQSSSPAAVISAATSVTNNRAVP